jgi:hypothetical protein
MFFFSMTIILYVQIEWNEIVKKKQETLILFLGDIPRILENKWLHRLKFWLRWLSDSKNFNLIIILGLF